MATINLKSSSTKSGQPALKPLFAPTDPEVYRDAMAERKAASRGLTEPFTVKEHEALFTRKWGLTGLELVACGAFGQIYEAQSPVKGLKTALKSLLPGRKAPKEKKVALKIVTSKYCTPKMRSIWHRRAQREIAILKALRGHAHIVSYQDSTFFGFDNAKTKLQPYLAIKMEYLPYDLALVSESDPLSWEELSPVVDQIGDALEWMHTRAIVHHDIKLSNIMCTYMPSLETGRHWALRFSRFKMVDFGLARCYATVEKGVTLHQETTYRAGTTRYKSPEKEDQSRPYNPFHADNYAFATAMVAALLGETAFYRTHDRYKLMTLVFENVLAQESLPRRQTRTIKSLYMGLRALLVPVAYRVPLKAALEMCKLE